MSGLHELLTVRPGGTRLAEIDPRSTPGLPDKRVIGDNPKRWSQNEVAAISQELNGYQERLFASAKEGATNRPSKHWKYNPGDLAERARWDDYQQAYADAVNRCRTTVAPWYVVPADRKWYRNWAVATLLRGAFADIDPQYPSPDFDVAAERTKLLAAD